MKDKKTELTIMLVKYARAGIPLTTAEKNLVKYLLNKDNKKITNQRHTPKNRGKCQWSMVR